MKWLLLFLFISCNNTGYKIRINSFNLNSSLDGIIDGKQTICDANIGINRNESDHLAFQSGDYYLIYNTAQLLSLSLDTDSYDKNFKLMTHINLSGINWSGIGRSRDPFQGSFDGSFCNITNLSYYPEASEDQNSGGLFTYIENAQLERIVLNSLSVKADISGGLIGFASESNISKVLVMNAQVSGASSTGGVIGACHNCKLSKLAISDSDINGSLKVGGILGTMTGDTNSESFLNNFLSSNLNINGLEDLGGAVGSLRNSTLQIGYSNSFINGDINAGGIAGNGSVSSILDVFSLSRFQINDKGGHSFGTSFDSVVERFYFAPNAICSTCSITEKESSLSSVREIFDYRSRVFFNWDVIDDWIIDPVKGPIIRF